MNILCVHAAALLTVHRTMICVSLTASVEEM